LFSLVLGWLAAGGRGDLMRDPSLEMKFLLLPTVTLVVQACLLLLVMRFVVINLMTDVAYGVLNPRIRLGAGRSR
jgi:hypothetical protein